MSEQQKVFASLSGAFVVHVLLLALVFVLPSTRSIGSSMPAVPPEDAPREVTIVMGELLEKMEVEPPEPEPEPEPEPQPEPELDLLDVAKPFMTTDLNRREAEAPENARFESDRNTSAATELLPDPGLPQEEGPTTRGDSPLPYFHLQNRQFVDGRLDRTFGANSAAPAREAAAAPPASATPPSAPSDSRELPRDAKARDLEARNPTPQDAVARPEAGEDSGEDEETVEGADTPPEREVAEERARPAMSETDGPDEETLARKSFTDPSGSGPPLPEAKEGDRDAFAASRPEEDAPEGEAADVAEEKIMSASGTGIDTEGTPDPADAMPPGEEPPADAPPEPAPESANPADVGLFADGFSPEEIQNSTNGTLTNIGQNAVDAEETPVGRYKKKVKDAIGLRWHRFVQDHYDFASPGVFRVSFRIDRGGNVQDLRVIKNEANAVVAEFSLKSILEANIPPMPKEVAEELGSAGLSMDDMDFVIY